MVNLRSLLGLKKDIILETNAPGSWPKIRLREEDFKKGRVRFLFSFFTKLMVEAKKNRIQISGPIYYECLGPEGVIDIPCQIKYGKEEAALFPYSEVNDANSGEYLRSKRFMMEKFGVKSYYYAPGKLNEKAKETNPFRIFKPRDVTEAEGYKADGIYSLWWSSKKGEGFSGSRTRELLMGISKNLDGIEPYAMAQLGRSANFVSGEASRADLPEEELVVPVKGPDDRVLLICSSKEKGIVFKFHTKDTPPEYRDEFLATFLDYVKELKRDINGKGLKIERYDGQSPNERFSSLVKSFEADERKGKGLIDPVVFKDGSISQS